jgi:hypothetical protein
MEIMMMTSPKLQKMTADQLKAMPAAVTIGIATQFWVELISLPRETTIASGFL